MAAGEQWRQKQWAGERCQPRLQTSRGALGDVRSPYCRANEMATHCTQRCCKTLSLWRRSMLAVTFQQGVILRWLRQTRSSEIRCLLKNIKQDSPLKQMLQTDFWVDIVKFCDTICRYFSRYNLGVNMSASQHAPVMCSFKKCPCPLKATGSFSMSKINSKYLCMASKGAYIADSTSSNKYWRKCWGGILLIDAVLFPF